MNRMKKERGVKNIMAAWYYHIKKMGCFNCQLNYDEVFDIICKEYPTYSKTLVHSVFWECIFNDKSFLARYEY